ncbi:DPP IV N-terminal domain-containing protein [Porticoccaceae bacterium]|nr:DPP IV N-terminal domain-containing protein [Porticoccaceae bacterium]
MTNNSTKNYTTDDQSILARYRRAEALEHASFDESMVLNAQIVPHWVGSSDYFWYSRSARKSPGSTADLTTEYRLINAKTATNTEAFDHVALAKALAGATNQLVDALSLPISNLEFDLDSQHLTFDAFDQRWQFDGAIKSVEKRVNHPSGWLVSPDGEKAAFIKDYNVWVREIDSGEERALTQDGQQYYAYAVQPESRDLVGNLLATSGYSPGPEAQWSPDSSQLFTMQTDERQVRNLPSMLYAPQDGTVAPRMVERKYALPGDKQVAQYRLLAIDVATAIETAADYPPIADSLVWQCPFSGNLAWWSGDSRYAYFVDMTRGQKTARMVSFDVQTGVSKVLFEESSPTYLELGLDYEHPSMLMHLSETNELIWSSERSGWWHLYRYDLNTGELKNAITAGDWLVRSLLHFDKDSRELWIQLAGRVEGRNPYYRELARVNIDTGEMTVLASSDHDYCIPKQPNVGVSSTGNFVVTIRARVDEAPITELRDRHGAVVLTVETADISGLPEGWQWPEPVTMKADDGITDIYGVVFRPSDFDPDKKYPVVDAGMASPFYSMLPTGAFLQSGTDPIGNYLYMTMFAIAELGFIVTVMDGRSTPYRSKAFNDFAYGSFMDGGGMVDHVAGIKQLAERYPSMDMERVGLVSTDGPGNGSIFGLLNYPDFYKVGVAFSPWGPNLVRQGEVYCGIIDEADRQASVWQEAAQRLEGKLLVVTGLLDMVFHSSMTFQLVDALVKANKDVDLLIQPNGGHGLRVRNAHRRGWDYLVQHLQGAEPPKNFKLITAGEKFYPGIFTEVLADKVDD